jgi:hypothetical protein
MDCADTGTSLVKPARSAKVPAAHGLSPRSSPATVRIRMLVARAMLRDGGDRLTVAEVTHLPLALVELMCAIDAGRRPHRRGWG